MYILEEEEYRPKPLGGPSWSQVQCEEYQRHSWKKELLFQYYHEYCIYCEKKREAEDKTWMEARET